MKRYTTLQLDWHDAIAIITFQRPEKLNALNQVVMEELQQALEHCWKEPTIKGIILTGAGPKAFIAGADITEFQDLDPALATQMAKKGQALFTSIEKSSKPIIAAVNGFALGGGCELAMSCHIRIASDNAKFGQPEVALGLIPGYGGTQRLPQLVGKGKALEMILTGNPIDAAEALRIGLVNDVVTPSDLLQKATTLLDTILAKAPLAVAAGIEAVQAYYDSTDGYHVEASKFGNCFSTTDTKEGVQAFIEKRKAQFIGK